MLSYYEMEEINMLKTAKSGAAPTIGSSARMPHIRTLSSYKLNLQNQNPHWHVVGKVGASATYREMFPGLGIWGLETMRWWLSLKCYKYKAITRSIAEDVDDTPSQLAKFPKLGEGERYRYYRGQ